MVSKTGYRRRTYEEILNAKIEKAKELFGENINTDENTPLGKYIRINAYDQYHTEEIAEKIYYSIFPQTASGQSLDRLGWTIGMTRNVAIPSRYVVEVTGNPNTIIDLDFTVETESGLVFYNTKEATIGYGTGKFGTCEIIVECTESGKIGNIIPSEINKISTPNASIDSVIGKEVNRYGEEEESDYDFIKRYEIVREGKGGCTEASIISELTNIPTVRGAYIAVNESATETIDGIHPKTIKCYVDGSEDYSKAETYRKLIAEAIFRKKPIGVETQGTIVETISYGGLKDYTVGFSQVETEPVVIRLEIITSAEFDENDGYKAIKKNIAEFIDNLGIGKSLIPTMLYSQIYSVSGVITATSLQISIFGTEHTESEITVDPYKRFELGEITINGEKIE